MVFHAGLLHHANLRHLTQPHPHIIILPGGHFLVKQAADIQKSVLCHHGGGGAYEVFLQNCQGGIVGRVRAEVLPTARIILDIGEGRADQAHFLIRSRKLHLQPQFVRMPLVVIIQKGDPLALSRLNPYVSGVISSLPREIGEKPDIFVGFFHFFHKVFGFVLGAVGHDDHFQRGVGLAQSGVQSAAQQGGPVPGGNHHTDKPFHICHYRTLPSDCAKILLLF